MSGSLSTSIDNVGDATAIGEKDVDVASNDDDNTGAFSLNVHSDSARETSIIEEEDEDDDSSRYPCAALRLVQRVAEQTVPSRQNFDDGVHCLRDSDCEYLERFPTSRIASQLLLSSSRLPTPPPKYRPRGKRVNANVQSALLPPAVRQSPQRLSGSNTSRNSSESQTSHDTNEDIYSSFVLLSAPSEPVPRSTSPRHNVPARCVSPPPPDDQIYSSTALVKDRVVSREASGVFTYSSSSIVLDDSESDLPTIGTPRSDTVLCFFSILIL